MLRQNLPGSLGRLCSFTYFAVALGQELCQVLQLCCLFFSVCGIFIEMSLGGLLSDCDLSAATLQLGVDGGWN